MTSTLHPVDLSDEQLLAQCDVRRQRRSGPGGQHRNKVETGVFIRHLPTNVEAAATEKRSQAENRKVAIERLRLKLAVQHRTVVAKGKHPSELWQSRCRRGRVRVSTSHRDFPSILAEAMDFLEAAGHDSAQAAEQLGCTRSQLTKLFKQESTAFERVNAARSDRGLAPLK